MRDTISRSIHGSPAPLPNRVGACLTTLCWVLWACGSKTPPEVRAAPEGEPTLTRVQFLDGTAVRVAFPKSSVPVFEVHYQQDAPCDPLTPSGEWVEAFHLASRTRLLASFPLSTTFDPPG